jgi:hypothetical protein
MKQIIFAGAAALCTAVGLASFKTTRKTFATCYYFQVFPGSGNKPVFYNDEVTYLGTTKPNINPCNPAHPTPTYKCVLCFTANQVTGFGANIKLQTTLGYQIPGAVVYYRTAL